MDRIIDLVIKLGKKDNVLPIKDKIWEKEIDNHWKFILNGCKTFQNDIPPANLYIEYNGLPAGIIDLIYNKGSVVVNGKVNENAFIKSMIKAINS